MLHSRLPWHSRIAPNQHGAEVCDADGKLIGCFFDHRNADFVLSRIEVKGLKPIVEKLDKIHSEFFKDSISAEEFGDEVLDIIDELNTLL